MLVAYSPCWSHIENHTSSERSYGFQTFTNGTTFVVQHRAPLILLKTWVASFLDALSLLAPRLERAISTLERGRFRCILVSCSVYGTDVKRRSYCSVMRAPERRTGPPWWLRGARPERSSAGGRDGTRETFDTPLPSALRHGDVPDRKIDKALKIA